MFQIITIPSDRQGPTGLGQGGWTVSRVASLLDGPVTVALRSGVPLDTPLHLVVQGDGWQLQNQSSDDLIVVMDVSRWEPHFASTDPVTPGQAAEARSRFAHTPEDHPVPLCFSCGVPPKSMCVHPGPLDEGRYATDWTVPAWADAGSGVDDGVLWAALDCTSGFFVSSDTVPEAAAEPRRVSFTVQYAAEVLRPLEVGEQLALVAWSGDSARHWEGRKRGAASAAFDASGECVASARSFWVSTFVS